MPEVTDKSLGGDVVKVAMYSAQYYYMVIYRRRFKKLIIVLPTLTVIIFATDVVYLIL